MKVFISWSGEESHAVATALRDHLPLFINAVKPFVSSEDISKGAQWFQSIASELEGSAFGIVCLTKKNLQSKWILFEAGALAGKLTKKRVAPLLVGLKPDEVEPPLGQLQSTTLEKEDFFKLLLTLNSELKENSLTEDHLKRAFATWWDSFSKDIKGKLDALPKEQPVPTERTDRDILNEVLSLARSIAANISNSSYEKQTAPILGLSPFEQAQAGFLLRKQMEDFMPLLKHLNQEPSEQKEKPK